MNEEQLIELILSNSKYGLKRDDIRIRTVGVNSMVDIKDSKGNYIPVYAVDNSLNFNKDIIANAFSSSLENKIKTESNFSIYKSESKTTDEQVTEIKEEIAKLDPTLPKDNITVIANPNGEITAEVTNIDGDKVVLAEGMPTELINDIKFIVKPIVESGISIRNIKQSPAFATDGKLQVTNTGLNDDAVVVQKATTDKLNKEPQTTPFKQRIKDTFKRNEFESVNVSRPNKDGTTTNIIVNNKAQLRQAEKAGYLSKERQVELATQPINDNELNNYINNDRYTVKVSDSGSRSTFELVDNLTGVTRPIDNNVNLAISKDNSIKVIDRQLNNLDETDNLLIGETISNYVNNNKEITANPTQVASPSNTADVINKTPTLGEKLSSIEKELRTGDKTILASQTIPALINTARGLFEKVDKFEPINNPYGQTALNEVMQRKFNIDRTAGRLKTQAAMQQVNDNSQGTASQMANLANLAANDKRIEDEMSYKEADMNQRVMPLENATLANTVGEGLRVAKVDAINAKRLAQGNKENMLTTGIDQLSNVGSNIGSIINQRQMDKEYLDWSKTKRYAYNNVDIEYTGARPSTQSTKSNKPVLEGVTNNVPNIPNLYKPLDTGLYKPYTPPFNVIDANRFKMETGYKPIGMNMEQPQFEGIDYKPKFKDGGNIHTKTALNNLKQLKSKLNRLKQL